MSARFLHLLLASLLVLVLAGLSSASRAEPLVGGWRPIKNMSDPHISEVAQFAVSEHNKQTNSKLELSRVIKGQTQVVEGQNYKLIIGAKDGGKDGKYEAVVWEKVWEKFMELTSFKLVKK